MEELRIQGLYLPQKGAAIPLDIAAHIFFPAPFGKDGGQDSIKASEGRVRVNLLNFDCLKSFFHPLVEPQTPSAPPPAPRLL